MSKTIILILDFGSQYTELIARRVRELGVYCEIHPYTMTEQAIVHCHPAGIILSGGPATVVNQAAPRVPEVVFQLNCPVLGICYGMQAMAVQLGGTVEQGAKCEFGYAALTLPGPSTLLYHIADRLTAEGTPLLDVWMSHGDHVSHVPPGFSVIASTAACPIAGMADENRKFYGLQFHPEVSHTKQGKRLYERFVREICHCETNWTPRNIVEEQIKNIQTQVGTDHVVLGLSGGVDSSVTALLLHRAIRTQLHCIFVETGLLRLREAEQLQALFVKQLDVSVTIVDAQKRFFEALKNITDPEQKRKIIGQLFIDIFEEEARKIPSVKWLAQGTIYSDVIESAATPTRKSAMIKSHHNVGGLPAKLSLRLLEPLRELFKDEVRRVGETLGLSSEWLHRHPFPGPGLGVRVLGEVTPAFVETVRQADAILIEELHRQGLYETVSQAFAVFLPVKSVGVKGDARHYDYVIAIRMIESTDFMTAHWSAVPYEFLETVSNRICNEVPGVSRVVYDVSSKPPATIEWE